MVTLDPVGFGWTRNYLKLCVCVDIYGLVLDCVCIVHALKASTQIWFLSSADSQENIVNPNNFKPQVEIDDEFKFLLHDIDIPSDLLDV